MVNKSNFFEYIQLAIKPFVPLLFVAAVFALSQVAFYFAFKFIVSSLDPTKAKRQEAKAKSNRVLGKLGVSRWDI